MIKSGINCFRFASRSTICYTMTPKVLQHSIKTPMFIPYYLQFGPKSFSTSVKPGNRSFLGENNKLGKLEDIENGIKNKMELQKGNLKKMKRSDPKKAETA